MNVPHLPSNGVSLDLNWMTEKKKRFIELQIGQSSSRDDQVIITITSTRELKTKISISLACTPRDVTHAICDLINETRSGIEVEPVKVLLSTSEPELGYFQSRDPPSWPKSPSNWKWKRAERAQVERNWDWETGEKNGNQNKTLLGLIFPRSGISWVRQILESARALVFPVPRLKSPLWISSSQQRHLLFDISVRRGNVRLDDDRSNYTVCLKEKQHTHTHTQSCWPASSTWKKKDEQLQYGDARERFGRGSLTEMTSLTFGIVFHTHRFYNGSNSLQARVHVPPPPPSFDLDSSPIRAQSSTTQK
jgi:hypothetical protein